MVGNTCEESDSLQFNAIAALNLHFPHRRPSFLIAGMLFK